MKAQKTSLYRRLSEEVNISGEVVSITPNHSQSLEDSQNDAHPNYVKLRNMSKKKTSRLTAVLDILTDLGVREEALVIGRPLQVLLTKELSYSRYLRWAFVDNFVEKILQNLLLSKQDISKENLKFCASLIRQVPSGRSLLLQKNCGLKKVYAARGLVLTTEMVLNQAVKAFIYVSLSYRLYEWVATGATNFSEFETIFAGNSKKGVSSLVRLLVNFDPEWLYLLLTSPAILGVLKGIWDTQKSKPLTQDAITQLQEAVNYHTNVLLKKSYLWGDVLRQLIPIPGFSSVSERVQRAEQQIRWDGRITNAQCASLFSNIERLALQGSGMSKINAMQSLAKIVHSLSIKDFHRLQDAGYSKEILVQILRIKKQALRDLKTLSTRVPLQPVQEGEQASTAALQKSLVSTVYAAYLLWWLGMGEFKYSPLFWSFKLGKLALEGLFIKTLVESILEVISCPDKKGFRMFFGDYEIWANELTLDCFNEFVKQFRLFDKEEPFQPFVDQLKNFDLRAVESINLINKALTSNETGEILKVLSQRAPIIKILNLGANQISDTARLSFPDSLQSLDLMANRMYDAEVQGLNLTTNLKYLVLMANSIGDAGAQGLKLPDNLQYLSLSGNNIGHVGSQGLRLPAKLQHLDLSGNSIGDTGAQGLKLPDNLQYLDLTSNSIGDAGAQRLNLPDSLRFLSLSQNKISATGVRGLKFPDNLQTLYLDANNICDSGAQGLQLPDNLLSLGLGSNGITAMGVQGLKLPDSLQYLSLLNNSIGDSGAQGLQLPDNLLSLDLWMNGIGITGAQGLKLPDSLQRLSLLQNNISATGAQGLKLPDNLQYLDLSFNNIGDSGPQGLKLPDNLQYLDLSSNGIGNAGAQALKLPDSLQFLILINNSMGAGIQRLKLPDSLQFLELGSNNIGDAEIQELKLPIKIRSLGLGGNNIGDIGAQELMLPDGLESLDLNWNNIGDYGVQGFKLPNSLQSLSLVGNRIGDEKGAEKLKFPDSLQSLSLGVNLIDDVAVQALKLPSSLQSLDLSFNHFGDEGVKALLQKIPETNLTFIFLNGNYYNSTTINIDRTIQQQKLLRNCQDKLCHANTPLREQQDGYQTSGAARAEVPLFFSWLKKPLSKLSEYASDCISTTFDSLGVRLEKVLSQSPSYFPNIHSPVIHDWQPARSKSVMLHQYNAQGSNALLLLSGTQAATQPSLRVLAW